MKEFNDNSKQLVYLFQRLPNHKILRILNKLRMVWVNSFE